MRDIESLNDEFEYFLFIKRKILHIVYQNCEDENYGHCDYALELFDFFMEIWDARIKLNREFIQEELELYKEQQISFKKDATNIGVNSIVIFISLMENLAKKKCIRFMKA